MEPTFIKKHLNKLDYEIANLEVEYNDFIKGKVMCDRTNVDNRLMLEYFELLDSQMKIKLQLLKNNRLRFVNDNISFFK